MNPLREIKTKMSEKDNIGKRVNATILIYINGVKKPRRLTSAIITAITDTHYTFLDTRTNQSEMVHIDDVRNIQFLGGDESG